MEEKRLPEIAEQIHLIGCWYDDPEHKECRPQAGKQYPIELAIAKWHLSRIEPLESALKEIIGLTHQQLSIRKINQAAVKALKEK